MWEVIMKKLLLMCSLVCLAGSLSGCVQRLTDFTIISSRNIDFSRIAEFTKGPRVEGSYSGPIILFLPAGIPNVGEAMDAAIEGVPGCVGLIDGAVDHEYFNTMFGYFKYTVKGTCLIDPKLVKAR
jgi:hypothetical protein